MKALKIILLIIVILGAAFYGGSFLLSPNYGVERSALIGAPNDVIFEQVNNLEKWPGWSPWSAMDPNMTVSYGDRKSGEGAQYSWDGPETGKGSLLITKSEPNTAIATDLTFDGYDGVAKGDWVFEPQEDGTTKVTWKFSATAQGTLDRYMGAFIDSFLGPMYEDGLASLETVSIKAAKEQEEKVLAEEAEEAQDTATVTEE